MGMQTSPLGEDVSWAWQCGAGHGTWLVLNPLSTDMRVVRQGPWGYGGLWETVGQLLQARKG